MREQANFIQHYIGKCVLSLVIAVGLVSTSFAAQFDAPYYELEKKHAAEWAREDKAIDAKLAELEKKFGKKPNIIYILVDDLGYGELGVQGAGPCAGHRRRRSIVWRTRGCCSTAFIPSLPVRRPVLP